MRGPTSQEPGVDRRAQQSYPGDAVHISRLPELWDELHGPVFDRAERGGVVIARQGSWLRVLTEGGGRAA